MFVLLDSLAREPELLIAKYKWPQIAARDQTKRASASVPLTNLIGSAEVVPRGVGEDKQKALRSK